jgi:hypothetical protein
MEEFEVIGYTSTGMYSETVMAESAVEALAKGKKAIAALKPLRPVKSYRVVQYAPDSGRQIDVTP